MATKKTYSVVVKTQGGDSFTFTGANGQKVYEQLAHKESVHGTDSNSKVVIIPFWSVDSATITVGTTTVDMTDSACVAQ